MDTPLRQFNSDSLRDLDCFLQDVLASMPIDIMPGETDPTTLSFPQQPMHRSLFSRPAKPSPVLECVTNPYWMDVDGVRWGWLSGREAQCGCDGAPCLQDARCVGAGHDGSVSLRGH
jgi:DNA polymerase II small subunit/DNA polymerase delta subunit B